MQRRKGAGLLHPHRLFALNAGIAGAESVLGVDASQLAVDQATENAKLNGLENTVRFSAVTYSPFCRNWKKKARNSTSSSLTLPLSQSPEASVKNATKGYREINLRAMKLLKDGGFLATCSCSHFMTYELFTQTIGQAAKNVHKRLRQVEYRTQSPDHPILWAADESYYLKFYIFQVTNQY
ncbi:MAG: class I SAM-dependent methyltransferase [Anaerotignum sp.]